MRLIHLKEQTYRRLVRQAESFDDDPETVIARLLTAAEQGEATESSAGAARVGKNALLPESEYWVPILRVIDDSGGSAPSAAVVEAIGIELKDRLTDADFDRVKSGEPRWQNRARFARLRMREMGLLSDTSPRGVWAITDRGRDYLAEETGS